jgi:uncharacterized protein YndB with AHSA1/START domain
MQATTSNATVTLPADDQILITREFDAAKELVYRAWTTPELVKRWFGGNHGEVLSTDIDLRVGGRWRYVTAAGEGREAAFHGEYREIVPNERIVSTEVYEAAPEAEALDTITFAQAGAGTTVTILMQLPSKEARDAVIASGMEDGLQDALELLEQVANSVR